MLQAITTKFHGPTNHRGARVTAECDAGKITVSWDHALNVDGNHRAAARALITKLGWWERREWHGGSIKGAGYVFVAVVGEPLPPPPEYRG